MLMMKGMIIHHLNIVVSDIDIRPVFPLWDLQSTN